MRQRDEERLSGRDYDFFSGQCEATVLKSVHYFVYFCEGEKRALQLICLFLPAPLE